MHRCWWTLLQAGLFLTTEGRESVGLCRFLNNPYPVCGVRQPRNLGHEDSVDLTLQSADYKVTGLDVLTIFQQYLYLSNTPICLNHLQQHWPLL